MSTLTDTEVDGFIEFMTTEKNSSPKTLENYTLALRLLREWLGDRFSKWRDLTADHFRAYLFELQKAGLARSTVRLRFAAYRSFYKFLVHRRGYAKSPVAEVELPKADKPLPVVLTLTQIEELLALPMKSELEGQAPAWMRERDAAILELFYSTGLRLAELASLDVEDIDTVNESVRGLRLKGQGSCKDSSSSRTAAQALECATQLVWVDGTDSRQVPMFHIHGSRGSTFENFGVLLDGEQNGVTGTDPASVGFLFTANNDDGEVSFSNVLDHITCNGFSSSITNTRTYEWNHGLGEIITGLTAVGMQVTGLVEHESAPWDALPGQMTRGDDGEWRLSDRPERLACTYTLQAVKV